MTLFESINELVQLMHFDFEFTIETEKQKKVRNLYFFLLKVHCLASREFQKHL